MQFDLAKMDWERKSTYLPVGDAFTVPEGFLVKVTGLFPPHLVGGGVFATIVI